MDVNCDFFQKDQHRKKALVKLSPYIRRLIINRPSLQFTVEDNNLLEHLHIAGKNIAVFNCANLVDLQCNLNITPPSSDFLDSLKNSPQLKILRLKFDDQSLQSGEYIQSLIQVTTSLIKLEELELYYCSSGERKIDGRVTVKNSDLVSLKKFHWSLPLDIAFYPDGKFTCVRFGGTNFNERASLSSNYGGSFQLKQGISFRYEVGSDDARYEFCNLDAYTLTLDKASSLDQVKHFEVLSSFKYNVAGFKEILKRLNNIETVLFENFPNSEDVFSWASSLPSLREFVGCGFDEKKVLELLSNLKTSGPLKLTIARRPTRTISHKVHRLLNELREKEIVSEFHSNWQCNCVDVCWISNIRYISKNISDNISLSLKHCKGVLRLPVCRTLVSKEMSNEAIRDFEYRDASVEIPNSTPHCIPMNENTYNRPRGSTHTFFSTRRKRVCVVL